MPLEGTSDNAFQAVIKNLGKFPGKTKSTKDKDVMFLKVLMDSPVVQSLARAHDMLEGTTPNSSTNDASEVLKQVVHDIEDVNDIKMHELYELLKSPHIQSVIAAHDAVAKQRTVTQKCINPQIEPVDLKDWQSAVRMIGLTKRADQSLGLTVTESNNEIVVSRILHGGLIHKQALLHVGDIIREVNSVNVKGNPDLLKEFLGKSSGSYIFKIIPSYSETYAPGNVFMKCNFTFDPSDDAQIPSKEAGLNFKSNQVLKIVDHHDLQWWQAQHVNEKGEPIGRAGLIPSLELQERRKVLLSEHLLSAHKKPVCKMYKLSDYYNELTDDFLLYEEVALLPPFVRKVVLLVSHDSSISHHVKIKLAQMYGDLYKSPISHTSCETRRDNSEFQNKEKMLKDIKENKYFEFTESKNELYGTKYDSIRRVMKVGKTCVKDISLKNLKFLMTSEFMPYVIFLKPANDIAEHFSHSINFTIPHQGTDATCVEIHNKLKELSTQHQWVPVGWLY